MKIGIISAMDKEMEQIVALLDNPNEHVHGLFKYLEGRLNGNDIVVMQCGIGKVNAALGTQELIRIYNPDCIINSGVAGGIDKRLSVMDVIVSTAVAYHDVWCGVENEKGQIQGLPTYFYSDETLLNCATNLDSKTIIHAGLICSGDQFIDNAEDLSTIKKDFPDGLAVDMESGAIAQTCYLYNTPFISFRVISDTPGIDNNTAQYENFWECMANTSFNCTKNFILNLPKTLF